MGTQAMQALERRTGSTRAGSAASRNAAGTREARARARADSGPSGTALRRKGNIRKQEPWKHTGRLVGQAQYGGNRNMDEALRTNEAMKRTTQRANPQALTRQLVDAISQKSQPAESMAYDIWDDPKYGQLAHEYGGSFAKRARDLDRQINQANRFSDIQEQEMARRNRMEKMKLEGRQLENEQRRYAPLGQDPYGPLETDSSGAFTGEGKQRAMVGTPPTEADIETQQRQEERQAEMDKSHLEGLFSTLEAAIADGNDELVGTTMEEIRNLRGGGEKKSEEKKTVTSPDGKEYSVGDTLPNGKRLVGINPDGTLEVE